MSRKDRRVARRERRAERRRAADTVMPPEGVPLRLPVAGVGVRISAQIADILITGIAAMCIVLLLFVARVASPETAIAIASLLFFLIRVPYYVLAELVWNGQTLGKKWMKIKVVSHSGGSLTTHSLVLRNLMKEAEIFLPATLLMALDAESPIASLIGLAWVMATLSVPLIDSHRRRLGDFMAGTHVVHLPVPVLLKDMAREQPKRSKEASAIYSFLPHQLDHYGAFELQTLETVLRRATSSASPHERTRNTRTLATIVERVRAKISYADPVPPSEAGEFLKAFYNAQRAHLEQRQLFGDRRADKHHAKPDPAQEV